MEAEDVELGDARRDDEALAFDVDGDIDVEALDSDDEEAENEELGIKAEDTDGKGLIDASSVVYSVLNSSHAYRPIVCVALQREADGGIQRAISWHSASSCGDKRRRNITYHSRNPLCSRLRSRKGGELTIGTHAQGGR